MRQEVIRDSGGDSAAKLETHDHCCGLTHCSLIVLHTTRCLPCALHATLGLCHDVAQDLYRKMCETPG